MLKDLFLIDNALSMDDRMEIISNLSKLGVPHPCCSACGSGVDIGFMRKVEGAPINEAKCLPCHLHNHTNENQNLIDKIVEIADHKGWYHD